MTPEAGAPAVRYPTSVLLLKLDRVVRMTTGAANQARRLSGDVAAVAGRSAVRSMRNGEVRIVVGRHHHSPETRFQRSCR